MEEASASQAASKKENRIESSGKNKSYDIRIENFDVSFGERVLLTGAELHLATGRRYGLVGRNGLGKTTLLKMLASRSLRVPSHISILHVEQEVDGDDTPALQSVLECDTLRESLLCEEKELNARISAGNDVLSVFFAMLMGTCSKYKTCYANMAPKVFIDRFRYNANRASQVQSKLKLLEKLPELQPIEKDTEVILRFPDGFEKFSPPILQLDEADFWYSSDQPIFNKLSVSADLDSRICVVGENGAGKSTMLKLLMGELSPVRGIRHAHRNLKIGYFSQHHVDQLDLNISAVELLAKRFPGKAEEEYRHQLGSYGISGELAVRPVGGVILVSHDERFIRLVCQELWVCENGSVTRIEGGFDEYRDILQEQFQKEGYL
ncbi:hypothetical protein AB205_0151780 [Aquarana catesbeiana]|uniref:ABC transporter domain-containing protein n=1 Tax=Aquarana catesbeiana TaxID=8400 RepID=A0A2G9S7J6_AQUCT|nr:hypothetical protein AB205_0151780 [Aquarana catesbeiana]